MIVSRRKKGDKPRSQIVPTELPVFSELERKGWVVPMSQKPKPKAKGRKKAAR